MPQLETSSDGRPRWWRNVWLRAGLLHPAFLVAPWVGLCLHLAAGDDSELNDVAWAFWVIPLSAIGSFIATAVMAARSPLTTRDRLLTVIVGLFGSGIALVLGFVGWFHAADVACHGRYECPF
jgi:hypothetical protein